MYTRAVCAPSVVSVLKGCFMATVGLYVVYRFYQVYGGVPAMFHQIALRSPAQLTLLSERFRDLYFPHHFA
jgi:NADH:ubiquinone oxidoreductase subunit 5 (subunit L)/multisubunit Na+/H+ antiporter MnhA subunit